MFLAVYPIKSGYSLSLRFFLKCRLALMLSTVEPWTFGNLTVDIRSDVVQPKTKCPMNNLIQGEGKLQSPKKKFFQF